MELPIYRDPKINSAETLKTELLRVVNGLKPEDDVVLFNFSPNPVNGEEGVQMMGNANQYSEAEFFMSFAGKIGIPAEAILILFSLYGIKMSCDCPACQANEKAGNPSTKH